MAPLISVIVPVYNQVETLGRSLKSLQLLDYPASNFEIIVIDNGCTDGSSEILRRENGIRLINELRRGAYAARNAGLRFAKGEIVAFTDPDCLVEPNWLTEISAAFYDPGTRVLLGNRRPAKDYGAVALLADYESQKDEYVLSSIDALKYYGYTNNMAVRKEVFAAIGVFPEVLRGGDTVFVQKVVERFGCGSVNFNPSMKVCHLEIDAIAPYMEKVFIYGRSHQRNQAMIKSSPLSYRDRLNIYKRTIAGRKLKFPAAIALFALLTAGLVAWLIGRLTAFVYKSSPKSVV